MRPDRWIDITPSEFPHEQRALDYLKEHLPDREPYRAWGPFAFRAGDSWPEVDCVVVGSKAIFLIEIKSWTGDLDGDDSGWRLDWGDGRTGERANPYPLTDSKAKKLKGRLEKTKALKGIKVPRVEPLIFFSEEDFVCRLPQGRRQGLFGLDPDFVPDCQQGGGLKGIIHGIENWPSSTKIDAQLSKQIADAMQELGIEPSERYTKVGPYKLDFENAIDDRGEVALYKASHGAKPDVKDCRVVVHKSMDDHPQSWGRARALLAARREFDLLWPQATHHPGLVRAEHLEEDHPLGPAVVFRMPPESVRLDSFLDEERSDLSESERVELLRKLAEAVRFAHSRNMYHRAIRPSVIHVHRDFSGELQPVVSRWDTGFRAVDEQGNLTAVAGTEHIGTGDPHSDRYLAPEIGTAADPDPALVDVFGLGAVAYLILTGEAPPADQDAAFEASGGYLDASAADRTVGASLCEVVAGATRADATQRMPTVDEFIDMLKVAVEDDSPPADEPAGVVASGDSGTTTPSGPPEPKPERLRRGDHLGRFEILDRLPRGSSGLAFVARREDDQREGVLKIAAEKGGDGLIVAEAEALEQLHSASIVDLFEGPVELVGRQAIFIRLADLGTLRTALVGKKPLKLAEVRQFASDLLEAVAEIEHRGIHHRDIKPDNIGIWNSEDGEGGSTQRAMLFDFSLAAAPADELRLGTIPYTDPFLGPPGRPEFDFAADRYSAAVVLHEMLTGVPPKWGEGISSPAHSEAKLKLATGLFPEELSGLNVFFERALARRSEDRFIDAAEMRAAWEEALTEADGGDEVNAGDAAEATVALPDRFPSLVINMLGARIRVAFRKLRSRVSEGEVEAVRLRLAGIAAEDCEYDSNRKRWLIDSGPVVAEIVSEVAGESGVKISSEAEEVLLSQGGEVVAAGLEQSVRVGPFELRQASPPEESFRGQPPSKADDQDGRRFVYELEGPDDLVLTIGDELFENGERQIRVVDAQECGARFERLVQGCRLTVARHGDFQRIDLRQARMKDENWSNMKMATEEQLAGGLGEDVVELLKSFGAVRVGPRHELIGDESTHRNYLCALFPSEADFVPLVAYVATRVAPVERRYQPDSASP